MCVQSTSTYADPWVLQSLLGGDSLGWVDRQHLVDQIFSLRSHRVPLRGGELKRTDIPTQLLNTKQHIV